MVSGRKFLKAFILIASILFCAKAMAQEVITVDEENGFWAYEKANLKIEIRQKKDTEIPLVWYEVELWCSPEEPIVSMVTNEEKPGASFKSPQYITRTNQYVFAINDDFFGDRIYNKEMVGVSIRNEKLISSKTYKRSGAYLPNLDTLAIYKDGSVEVNYCAEVTPEEFLERGAVDVFAFGPILIRDGEINPVLDTHFRPAEPRVGFGMIEPYHYAVVVVEGRHSKSRGHNCLFVAQRLLEMGAVQALNLDGGQTSALMFMGEKINITGKSGRSAKVRNLSGMITVGVSSQVPEYK